MTIKGIELLTDHMTGEFGDFCRDLVSELFQQLLMSNLVSIETLMINRLEDVTQGIRLKEYGDIFYDQPSSVIVTGVKSGHQYLASTLFFAHQVYEKKPQCILEADIDHDLVVMTAHCHGDREATVAYLNSYGLFKSSISGLNYLEIGEDLELNGQERFLFKEYKKFRHGLEISIEETYTQILEELVSVGVQP